MLPVDYDFYRDAFGGDEIEQKQFNRYVRMAVHFIKSITVNSPDLSDDYDYKTAVCHVAEILMKSDKNSGISREDNDGYSVSYEKNEYRQLAAEIVSVYLADKGVLYCGMNG